MRAYDKDGNVLARVYDAAGNLLTRVYAADGTPIPIEIFLPTAVLTALPTVTVSGNKQGACTDGTYIYQICINTRIGVKYQISDGTFQTFSIDASLPINHGNDMAYNPNNQHLYVAAMSADGAVLEFDNGWNYVTTHYLTNSNGDPVYVWGLCFDQNTNCFYSTSQSGGGIDDLMLIYDESFTYIDSILMSNIPTATAQGCETDGEYIYHIWYNPNLIHICTMDGTYVTTITNPMSGEPETLMYDWINDKFYINRNNSTYLYLYDIKLKYD